MNSPRGTFAEGFEGSDCIFKSFENKLSLIDSTNTSTKATKPNIKLNKLSGSGGFRSRFDSTAAIFNTGGPVHNFSSTSACSTTGGAAVTNSGTGTVGLRRDSGGRIFHHRV